MADNEFQDQGALDEPQKTTDGPYDRIKDVHAGPHEGGPVNPVKDDLGDPAVDNQVRRAQEADPTAEADNTSASTLAQVNEARESGQPLNETPVGTDGVEQPSTTPGGTGVSAG